ncbi:hypothetical protein [Streptomyces sp. NPDC048172]|uniref:hypothetical protein n=1 Tax=Streptomyces sp. NPDC048172 TaxID=3365505 RepID=UPI0037169B78
MTAESNGTGAAPEGDEDPFAYLYRQEGSTGATAQQPGVPRRSYNQVRAVGERQYGGPQAQTYQPPAQPPTVPPQQPNAHYAAPETMPGGRAAARHPGGPGGGQGRGARRNRNGLLIGAIAVVAAVVAGIGAAIVFNDDGDTAQGAEKPSGQEQKDKGGQDDAKDKGKKKPAPQTGLPPRKDAAGATLAGGAAPAKDVAKAQGKGGTYVGGMNQTGASVTWTMKDIPKSGKYTVFVRYGVPGEDANSTLTVNGEKIPRPVSMKNFTGAKKGDWEAGWTKTFAWVDLEKGRNRVQISCGDGNKCNFNLDQFWLKEGWVKN